MLQEVNGCRIIDNIIKNTSAKMNNISQKRLSYWNERSSLGYSAGSGDVNLKRLEVDTIKANIDKAKTILDAGCGNGIALYEIIRDLSNTNAFGFDYSEGMINKALELFKEKRVDNLIKVCVGDLLDPPESDLIKLGAPKSGFDLNYTERSIINLNTLDEQIIAIKNLWKLLKVGGKMILCESFIDGLNEINSFRSSIGIEDIKPPWHNRYLSKSEINLINPSDNIPEFKEFSGSYYFISRIVNAFEAKRKDTNPSYDDPMNLMSINLESLDVCGQAKLVIFRK